MAKTKNPSLLDKNQVKALKSQLLDLQLNDKSNLIFDNSQIRENLNQKSWVFNKSAFNGADEFVEENLDDIYLFFSNYIGFINGNFFGTSKGLIELFPIEDFCSIRISSYKDWDYILLKMNTKPVTYLARIDVDDKDAQKILDVFTTIQDSIKEFIDNVYHEKQLEKDKELEEKNQLIQIKKNKQKENLNKRKESITKKFKNNSDNTYEIVSCEDFDNLLEKYQKEIIQIDRSYIQQFVKVSKYLKTKKSNIEGVFKLLLDSDQLVKLEDLYKFLKNEIHTYELLLFHSLNMITALIDDNMITFYEIYESFDKLNIFNSNWENEVTKNLGDISQEIVAVNSNLKVISSQIQSVNNRLRELLYATQQMERNIISSVNSLTYTTKSSFDTLNASVNNKLAGIQSSLKFNNLMTGIQTYKMLK